MATIIFMCLTWPNTMESVCGVFLLRNYVFTFPGRKNLETDSRSYLRTRFQDPTMSTWGRKRWVFIRSRYQLRGWYHKTIRRRSLSVGFCHYVFTFPGRKNLETDSRSYLRTRFQDPTMSTWGRKRWVFIRSRYQLRGWYHKTITRRSLSVGFSN